MNLYIAVERIVQRVKELGIGVQFDYDEVNQQLGILSGDDLMWSYDKLSDRLIVKHRIPLELEEDCIFAVVPENSDIKAAEKRENSDS